MQTPQIFRTGLILHAYRKVLDSSIAVTDEVSAVQGIGHPIRLLPTADWNFKITHPRDLAMAEQVLATRRRPEPSPRPKRPGSPARPPSRKPPARRSRPPGATG
jgi:2-C-methyl-D-erythritol 4-phosphate cytidylyltransferase